MDRIMALSWETVNVANHLPSMDAEVDSSCDSNVGERARTTAPLTLPRGGQWVPVMVRRVTASMRR